MKTERPVLVTTEFKGVFFGYLGDESQDTDKSVVLYECRNAIYWDADTRGFLGLAENGPGSGCRIGATAPKIRLNGVTSIAECTKEAVEKWKRWKS